MEIMPGERREVISTETIIIISSRLYPRVFYRVPYSELRDNWEKWEREKYWDKRRDEDRERFPEERGRERYKLIACLQAGRVKHCPGMSSVSSPYSRDC